MRFQERIQQLSRAYEVFKEETTLAHRQHMHDHMEEQRVSRASLEQLVLKTGRSLRVESEGKRDIHSIIRMGKQRSTGADLVIPDLVARRSIIQWLDLGDMTGEFRRALKKRAPHTALWILENDAFQRWVSSSKDHSQSSRLLWIHGLPGTGKTVMSSTVIEHLQGRMDYEAIETRRVAYFYCGSQDQAHRTAFNICASALAQLVPHLDKVSSHLFDVHQVAMRHGRSKVSEDDEIFDAFKHLVATFPSTFLVIDALDECSEASDILSWLENILQSVHSFHVVVFSRDTSPIRESLGTHTSVRIDAASLNDDIKTYLASAIDCLPCEEEDLREFVLSTLSKRSEGMFLLANLSTAALQSATSQKDMLAILDTIPAGLTQIYTLILKRLAAESEARRCLASKVLRLLCFSKQMMTWPEMRRALSWNEAEQSFERDNEPFKKTVSELCFPLVEYLSDNDTFRLAHLTVQEFLCRGVPEPTSSQGLAPLFVKEADAQMELAAITLASVADAQVSRRCDVDLETSPLLAYATKNWCYHFCQSPWDENLGNRFLEFMACSERRCTWILRWLLLEERTFALQQIVKIQRLVQERLTKCGREHVSVIVLLKDTQRALFHLDKILVNTPSPSSLRNGVRRSISNFERLMCVRDLAREYKLAGGVEEGVKMFESALREADTFGEDVTPGSCWLLNSLGILYDQQGRTEASRMTQLRALKIQETWLPENSLDIALTRNELGRIARHLGRFDDAESLHRKALTTLEKSSLAGDLQVVWTKNALARAVLKQNRPDEALVLHQQALATERDRLGNDHPHTLWTLSDIARCYKAQGNLKSAITFQCDLVERSQRTLGPDCLDTLWAKNSLGRFYELHGELEKAHGLHDDALRGQTVQLGSGHPHTVWSRQALAGLDKRIKNRDD